VWVLENGQLRSVRVRIGLTDGMTTAVLGDLLGEQVQVVTGVAAAKTTATAPSSSSPLIPQRPGGNRQGNTTRRQGTGR
jgi:hypothetical protein